MPSAAAGKPGSECQTSLLAQQSDEWLHTWQEFVKTYILYTWHEKVSENILHFFIMAYLTATLMAAFAPPTDMEAIQILPDRSWSATVRNLEGVISHIMEIRRWRIGDGSQVHY